MFGCVSANAATLPALKDTVYSMGICVGPDDMYLALRGLRTLGVRLARHYQSGLRIARWLAQRPEVLRVMHPALESDPGHAIWKRDFAGATGLFSIVLKPVAETAAHGVRLGEPRLNAKQDRACHHQRSNQRCTPRDKGKRGPVSE